MDRRRAAAALLALAACFACSTAAPTATDHTALELIEGHTEGCYYNFQHYGEGDRIMTNEPCLNCTCHNRMLMCYLRVCPFTKPIGQDCTVEKRADQCCPIVTCPDVPVDLLTSTSTSSPAEYGATGLGKQDKYGCSINGKYFSEGSKVPPTPNKPCEHCYCIRNMTTCVMQECTLHVDGCTPIYHKDVCCPVRYSCDHPEDEIPLLDDMTTTVRPTPGFLLTTTTTMVPVTQASQDCVHEDQIFTDGAHIKTEKACEHCYCMKGDIVCVVQGCGTPMENEGKNCTALPLRSGQCCPDTYICEGDEHNVDITTEIVDQSTTPPRRIGVEGSGYRNEPDEPFKEIGTLETDVEGSGDEYISSTPIDVESSSIDEKPSGGEDKMTHTTPHQDIHASQTTESEKQEEDISIVTSDMISSVIPEQKIESYTTEASSEFVYTPKQMETTISDEGQSIDEFTSKKEEVLTTESVFRKDDNNAGSDTLLHEEDKQVTTSSDYLTEATSFKEPERTGSTEFIMESAYDKKATTQSTKYVSDYVDTTKQREDMFDSQTESVYTDKKSEDKLPSESTIDKELPTTSSHVMQENINLSEVQTTTVDSIYNEINEDNDNNKPARIPGEGDCLLNGVTYSNNTNVPRSNNCHTSCKCVSSIIKCDPIICSPPPEYIENMNDCQPIYDSPDSCCPTYVCSAKETIPPQSHSQMSGTEAPRPIETVECNDSNCELGDVEKHPAVPTEPCLSDDCINKSKQPEEPICESNECGESAATVPPKLEDCSDGKCQVSPVEACEGENCDNVNEKPTVASEKPIDVNIDSSHKELNVKDSSICSDKEGCPVTVDSLQEECANETCRRKDEPKLETELSSDCSGVECKTINDVALTTKSDVDNSINIVTEESTFAIETATNKAVITEEERDQSAQDVTKQTVEIPASTESQKVTDQIINTENESEYTRLPALQTVSDITETEDIQTTVEKQQATDAAVETEKTYTDQVTEKMNIEQVNEKEEVATEREPIYTESSQSVGLTSEEFTEKIHSLTTESVIIDDKESDMDKTNPDTIYTISPTLEEDHKVTKEPEITEPEISTPVQSTQSSTIDHKPTDVVEIPKSDIPDLSNEEEELLKSTVIPIIDIDENKEVHDTLAITTDLPKSEFVDEPHHETTIADIEKDTFDVLHTTSELEETSTNKHIHEQINTVTNVGLTESIDLQNEVTEQTDVETPHETVIPDKLDNEQEFITSKPEIITDKLDTEHQSITDHPEVTSTDKLDSEGQLITDKLEVITEKSQSITYQPEVTSAKDITDKLEVITEKSQSITYQTEVTSVKDITDKLEVITEKSQSITYQPEVTSVKDITDKLEVITEKSQSITYQPEVTSAKDISQVSMVDDVSEYNIISTDVSQSIHSLKDDMTTKSYYDVTESKVQYKEPSEYSTPVSAQVSENILDTGDIEEDRKPSGDIDFTTISLNEEENLEVVTEGVVSYTIQAETGLNGDVKPTDLPMAEEEFTKMPDVSIEKSDKTTGAPNIDSSIKDDSDIPKQELPEVPILGDNKEIEPTMATEVNRDSSLSTETIITTPGSLQDMTYEIEVEKPKDSEKELNILDNTSQTAPSVDLITTSEIKHIAEDKEVLVTEPTPKYTEKVEQDFQKTTSSEILEEEDHKQSDIHEQKTTVQDNLIIQESSTSPQDENIQIEIQTMIPDTSDNEPKDQFTEVQENKSTTVQIGITQEVLKDDELLSDKGQSTEKYLTESQEINTAAIKDVEKHLGTTPKYIIDEVEHKPTDAQDLSEKSTWSPHLDDMNIQEEVESSTSFVDLETSKDTEKATGIVTEKVDKQDTDTNKLQTLADEETSKTEKPLSEESYPSHSTHEPTQTEPNTEPIPTQTVEITVEKNIEDKQEENVSEISEIIETDKVTTDNILISEDKKSSLPEHPSEEDEKLDESKHRLPEHEETTQFDISPPVFITEKDKVVTEAAHALVTNVVHIEGSEVETEIKTTTIEVSKHENRLPSLDVSFTTPSHEQASETPEYVHHKLPEIPNEISHDISVTSAIPEKAPTEHSYTTTVSLPHEIDVDEQSKVTQSVEQDKSENVTPTNIISVTEQSESVTENMFVSTSSQKEEEEVISEEEKKPATETEIIIDEKSTEVPSEHYVPVFVQDTELTHPEVSTVSASVIDIDQDQEQITDHDFTSTKPHKLFTFETIATDSVTEVYEKEKSSERVETDGTTESSKILASEEVMVNAPISTMEPEKSTESEYSNKPEITESERTDERTEIYISPEVEMSTPSVLEKIPEEKETLKPISEAVTTEGTYNSLTEKKPNDSLDISTELPEKIITDINKETTSSLHEQYTTSADYNKDFIEKEVTNVPELISEGTGDKSGNEIPEGDILTSPVPADKEIQSEKDINLSPSELGIPTEPTLPQKEVSVVTTESAEEDISDLNVPLSTEKNTNDREVTHIKPTHDETTPFSVELEEHTHSPVYDSSTDLPLSEISTEISYEPHEPERGDLGDNEEQVKPTERLPLDFEHKEKQGTTISDLTDQNIESTVAPTKLDEEIKSNTDQPLMVDMVGPTQEPIRTPITQTEEQVLTSSEQTVKEQESSNVTEQTVKEQESSNVTEQPILTPTSSVISTEGNVLISSEQPIKYDQGQTAKEPEIEETDKLSHVTTGKYEESIQTDSLTGKLPDEKLSSASPSSPMPELAKPVFNEEPVEDIASPDFPPSGAGGYGQEPDYVEEDQAFGPGTCRYGGKVYVSAQQIPRDDPCDFCFCFRSDIICLQQSCPPPIHGCHEEPIQGFCCPRYECPVSMATTLNMTTTTTTTTTTLPPHFLPHAYKGAAQRRGCQIKGHTYKVGEVVRASSGPCLHCTCGGDGQMKCDPKACTPEPMLRQMIAAAVSAKRRR